MKNTPKVSAENTNGVPNHTAINGEKKATFTITPGEVVSVGDLIEKARNEVNQPPLDTPAEPAPVEPVAEPVDAVAPSLAPKPPISRAEAVQYWNEKARKIQLLNSQLQNLRLKRDQLADFSFTVDKSDDHRFAKIIITDDSNVQFDCRNHGLVAIVVGFLKEKFSEKIDEKETEFLAVAHE